MTCPPSTAPLSVKASLLADCCSDAHFGLRFRFAAWASVANAYSRRIVPVPSLAVAAPAPTAFSILSNGHCLGTPGMSETGLSPSIVSEQVRHCAAVAGAIAGQVRTSGDRTERKCLLR